MWLLDFQTPWGSTIQREKMESQIVARPIVFYQTIFVNRKQFLSPGENNKLQNIIFKITMKNKQNSSKNY